MIGEVVSAFSVKYVNARISMSKRTLILPNLKGRCTDGGYVCSFLFLIVEFIYLLNT